VVNDKHQKLILHYLNDKLLREVVEMMYDDDDDDDDVHYQLFH
jgi:hypothetical protein